MSSTPPYTFPAAMLAFNMSCLASYVTFLCVAFVINHIPARLFSGYSRDGYFSRKYGTTCTRDWSWYEDYTISVTTLRVAVGNNFSCNDDSSSELSVVAGKKVTTSSRFEHAKYRLDWAAIYWKRDNEVVCICCIKPPVALQEAIHHQPQQVPCLTGKTTIYHHFCLNYSSMTMKSFAHPKS